MEHCVVTEIQPQELLMGLAEVIRETQKSVGYYEMKKIAKTHLDQIIEESLERQNKMLSEIEIAHLAGKLYNDIMMKTTLKGLSLLSRYYNDARRMNQNELLSEKHKPRRLSRHMSCRGSTKPLNVATHAIVSGGHPKAIAARRILAKWKIRIDDPDNGVYLPRDSRFIPHEDLPKAVNHAKLHAEEYYVNVVSLLSQTTSQQGCRVALRLIAKKLQEGTFWG